MKRVLFSLFALTLVSACSSTWDIDGVQGMEAKGSLFDKSLKHEYTELAAAERAEGDWPDTERFLARARASADGKVFEPEPLWARHLPAEKVDTLRAARMRLVRVLNAGARHRRPEEAAWAQAGFDCWMQEQEEGHQGVDIDACKKSFDTAMEILETPEPMARQMIPSTMKSDMTVMADAADVIADGQKPVMVNGQYVVYFGFASAKIRSEAQKIISDALSGYKADMPEKITVSGHADRAGPEAFNMKLSKWRAQAVSAGLKRGGVPSDKIAIKAYGESRPAVMTADGVRKQENRRVEIDFQ